MQLPLPLNDVAIPDGLPPWLVAFVSEAVRENRTLAENGADQAVTARAALLQKLVAAAQAHLETEMSVEQAACLLGRHPETVRRALRKGTLPDSRTKSRGRYRIRRGDVELLAAFAPSPRHPAIGYWLLAIGYWPTKVVGHLPDAPSRREDQAQEGAMRKPAQLNGGSWA